MANLVHFPKTEQAAKIDELYGSSYRAVLEGCAITVRSLCDVLGIKCNFNNPTVSNGQNRLNELLSACSVGETRIESLGPDKQRHLLAVLYLANRAVAHPADGGLDHNVGHEEMTSAINTLLGWLTVTPPPFLELAQVKAEFLKQIN